MLEAGRQLPEQSFPVTRADLVRYAGASGDFNPIHWSERFAVGVGLPGVIAHGMFTMALAARAVTAWAGRADAVVDFGVRFTRPVPGSGRRRRHRGRRGTGVGEDSGDGSGHFDLTAICEGEKVARTGPARSSSELTPMSGRRRSAGLGDRTATRTLVRRGVSNPFAVARMPPDERLRRIGVWRNWQRSGLQNRRLQVRVLSPLPSGNGQRRWDAVADPQLDYAKEGEVADNKRGGRSDDDEYDDDVLAEAGDSDADPDAATSTAPRTMTTRRRTVSRQFGLVLLWPRPGRRLQVEVGRESPRNFWTDCQVRPRGRRRAAKVIYPTRKELLTYTTVVVVFVTIMMTLVALLDLGFAKLCSSSSATRPRPEHPPTARPESRKRATVPEYDETAQTPTP